MSTSRLPDSHCFQGRWVVQVVRACATAVAAGSFLITMSAAEAAEGGQPDVSSGSEATRADASVARLPRDAGSEGGMLELRRQLLEHSRHWRGAPRGPDGEQALQTQGIRQVSRKPGAPQPSSLADGIVPAGALQRSPEATGHAAVGASPAESGADPRLSERERSLLRQQLLQNARRPGLGRER